MLLGPGFAEPAPAANSSNLPATSKRATNYFPWIEKFHEPDLIKWCQSFKVHKRTHGENLDVKFEKVAAVLNEREKFSRTGITLTASAAQSKYKALKTKLGVKYAFTTEQSNLSGLDEAEQWEKTLVSMMMEQHEQYQESSEKSKEKKALNKALVYREDTILGKDAFTAPIKTEDGFAEVRTPPSTATNSEKSSISSTQGGTKRPIDELIIIDIDGPIKKLDPRSKGRCVGH